MSEDDDPPMEYVMSYPCYAIIHLDDKRPIALAVGPQVYLPLFNDRESAQAFFDGSDFPKDDKAFFQMPSREDVRLFLLRWRWLFPADARVGFDPTVQNPHRMPSFSLVGLIDAWTPRG